jgi:hypothetical protein
MITFEWKPLELFATENQLISVRYLIVASDDKYTVESEGNHLFLPNTANKDLATIVESDIVQWLEKDLTVDGINPIKSNLEYQITNLKLADTLAVGKVDFPWLAGTFTIG